MSASFSFTVEGRGQRLDLCLSLHTGRSRSFVQNQITHGHVRVNGLVIQKPSFQVKSSDCIEGALEEPTTTNLVPIEKALDIIFEDDDLLILNKPQGWIVHPVASHPGETLVNYLLHYLNRSREFHETSPLRPGIVHRLDRGTSGVLLVAKNRPALEAMSLLFKDRKITKEYEAIVWGRPREKGMIRTLVGRHPIHRKKMSTQVIRGREAETAWQTQASFRNFSHLKLLPKTGRTHQLRVHLADQGNPIWGDAVYGGRKRNVPRIDERVTTFGATLEHPFLHARALSFIHPTSGQPISVKAERPELFTEALKLLSEKDL